MIKGNNRNNVIKISSIINQCQLLEEVKKHKNVIIVHHDSEYNHCHILLPDDEDGIISNAFLNIGDVKNYHNSEKPYFCLINRYGIEHGCCETTVALVNESGYNYFLDKLEEQKGITVLELENIEGDVKRLMCDSYLNSGRKEFTKEVLNYRKEQRMESSGDSKEQEEVTEEVAEGVIKLKSLRKKDDLLEIVKKYKKVVIVHHEKSQESQTPTDVSVFLPYKAERNSLLKSFDKYSDFDFHSLEENFEYAKFTTDQQGYNGLLNVFKGKNVTILELENIGDEIEYLLKPGFCGNVRREDFATSVVSAKKEETKLITTQNDQPHSPDGSVSSSSSTMTEQQKPPEQQVPIDQTTEKSNEAKKEVGYFGKLFSWLLPRNWGNYSERLQKFTQDSRESVAEAIKRFLKEKLQASDLHSCSTTDDIIDQLNKSNLTISDKVILCSFSGSGSDVLFKVSVLNQNSETKKFDDIKLEQKSECKKPDSDWKKEIIEKINEQFKSKGKTPLLIVNDTIMQQLNSDQKLKDDMFSKFNSTRSNSNDGTTWIDQIGY